MKNITILLFLICTLLSCKSSDDDALNMPNHLTSDNAKALIPLSSYATSSRVIFINQEGNEKSLNITLEEVKKEKLIGNFRYTVDQLSVSLNEEGNSNYSIQVVTEATYLNDNSSNEFLNCLLFNTTQSSNGIFIPSLKIESNREPIFGVFETEKQLLDKTFNNVYSNWIFSEALAYSELYYNVQFGVIGFKDFEDKLWVYERLE